MLSASPSLTHIPESFGESSREPFILAGLAVIRSRRLAVAGIFHWQLVSAHSVIGTHSRPDTTESWARPGRPQKLSASAQTETYRRLQMSSNRGVVYLKPARRSSEDRLSSLLNPAGKTIDHGVILKVVTTNICGSTSTCSGRTTAPRTRDHRRSDREGPDVEYLEIGDLVSVPSRCMRPLPDLSRRRHPRLPYVNSTAPEAPYGYVDMGGWIGGQAEYVMAPYAGFNLLKIPDKAQAMEKIRDLTCLSDILATGIPWSRHRQVGVGSEGLRRRRRAVGLATAASARILARQAVVIGDMNHEAACLGQYGSLRCG